jgi:hypothetical protein
MSTYKAYPSRFRLHGDDTATAVPVAVAVPSDTANLAAVLSAGGAANQAEEVKILKFRTLPDPQSSKRLMTTSREWSFRSLDVPTASPCIPSRKAVFSDHLSATRQR